MIIVQIYLICYIFSQIIYFIFHVFVFMNLSFLLKFTSDPLHEKKEVSVTNNTSQFAHTLKVCLIRVLIKALIAPILGSNDE